MMPCLSQHCAPTVACRCRWGYQHVEELVDVVAKYKAADIPLEVMWTDIDYMDGYRDFSLDPHRFPQDKMQATSWLHHPVLFLMHVLHPIIF